MDKRFLYEIVSNKRNGGMDVDKWDYLARDAYYIGKRCNTFDHNSFVMNCSVVWLEDGCRHIVPRDKEARNIYEMLYQRYELHRGAYQHRIANVAQYM